MKICVLERGWVLVGNLQAEGDEFILSNAFVIRRWGTSEGIGELAIKGPLENTKLDKTPLVRFHKSQMIFCIECDENNWKNV